jgi:hypothetical protein
MGTSKKTADLVLVGYTKYNSRDLVSKAFQTLKNNNNKKRGGRGKGYK